MKLRELLPAMGPDCLASLNGSTLGTSWWPCWGLDWCGEGGLHFFVPYVDALKHLNISVACAAAQCLSPLLLAAAPITASRCLAWFLLPTSAWLPFAGCRYCSSHADSPLSCVCSCVTTRLAAAGRIWRSLVQQREKRWDWNQTVTR
jgi:hypothetical protein